MKFSPVWRWASLVGVCVLAVNFPVLDHDWVMFDDDINVLLNPHLGCGAFSSVPWAFQNIEYMRRYLPLGWLGFAGLLAVDGYNAAVFHAANWLLTAFNAALAVVVFHEIAKSSRTAAVAVEIAPNRLTAASIVAALLWSLHPLRVENVAWISGFLYVASTTFALGAVLLHLKATAAESARRVTAASVGAAVLYLASCLVYPVFLALPAVVVWWSATSAPDSFRAGAIRGIRRTASWWISAVFVGAMNLFGLVTASEAYRDPTSSAALPSLETLRRVGYAVIHYLSLTAWPDGVSVYYGAFPHWRSPPALLLLPLVALAAVATLLSRRARRALRAIGVPALLALAPALLQMNSNFHPSDRYTILWLAVFAAALAITLCRRRTPISTRVWFASASLVLLLCCSATRHSLRNWTNSHTLQACIDRATAASPDVYLNFARPAVAFWWLGDHATSRARLQKGRQLFPLHSAMAEAQARVKEFECRWRQRVPATANIPPIAVVHVDLGRSWLARGERRAAEAHFARALQLAPENQDNVAALIHARRTP